MLLFAVACLSDTIDVHVASSADDAVGKITSEFSLAHPLTPIVTSRGPSSQLARQIQNGIEADVFVSADTQWADIVPAIERANLFHNRIVSVGVDDGGCIAVADPDHVPAGRYTKAALGPAWVGLEPRVVPLPDATAAARAVRQGICAFGYVYATDAKRAGLEAGPELNIDVTYVAVLLTERGRPLFEALLAPQARTHYAEHGFR